jgi:hypothetical protein
VEQLAGYPSPPIPSTSNVLPPPGSNPYQIANICLSVTLGIVLIVAFVIIYRLRRSRHR